MVIQELFIKNMVCDRCSKAVRHELESLGYQVSQIELGRATVEGQALNLEEIAVALQAQGFELLTDRTARVVSRVKTLIIELIQSGAVASLHITLSDYLAQQTGLEYSHLSHVFSQAEHLTVERYWILQRIERAKELLSYGELPIQDIARQLGYSSPAYLSNQFKQLTGLTPAAYRDLNAPDRNSLDWI